MLVLALTLVTAGAVAFLWTREPAYQGVTLTGWMLQFATNGGSAQFVTTKHQVTLWIAGCVPMAGSAGSNPLTA